jgi:hypothetical protein
MVKRTRFTKEANNLLKELASDNIPFTLDLYTRHQRILKKPFDSSRKKYLALKLKRKKEKEKEKEIRVNETNTNNVDTTQKKKSLLYHSKDTMDIFVETLSHRIMRKIDKKLEQQFILYQSKQNDYIELVLRKILQDELENTKTILLSKIQHKIETIKKNLIQTMHSLFEQYTTHNKKINK